MKLAVRRFISDAQTTIGLMKIDGKSECFTCEDEKRTVKVMGETRIPAGTYRIKVRKEGRFHEKYGVRFADIHKGMLWLQDVPGFTWILIHCGNTEADTAGCILVGTAANLQTMRIDDSTGAYRRLYTKVIDAALHDDLTITITDED